MNPGGQYRFFLVLMPSHFSSVIRYEEITVCIEPTSYYLYRTYFLLPITVCIEPTSYVIIYWAVKFLLPCVEIINGCK